ncbi:MAG TPA: hypothetical protein VGL68_01385 [Solirubrobacteraceae bacterium]|jgi:hypothetical protein
MSFANNTSHMLFIVIPLIWLTVVTLFVAVGRSAARGDGRRARPERREATVNTSVDGLVLWEDPVEVELQDMRPRKHRRLLAGHGLTHHGAR